MNVSSVNASAVFVLTHFDLRFVFLWKNFKTGTF